MKRLILSCMGALLAAPAAATTWIVDDDGGAGVNFTDIPPAIAAASAGDVILVLAGSYSGFVLNKPLAIVGSPGVLVQGDADVFGVTTGSFAALAGFSASSMTVHSCTKTVVVDDVKLASGIEVFLSPDVRLQRVRGITKKPSAFFAGSRVECHDADLLGPPGKDCYAYCGGLCDFCFCTPGVGEDALTAGSLSGVVPVVHVYRTDTEGGLGGYDCFISSKALNGNGIKGFGGGELLVAGQAEHVIATGPIGPGPALTLTTGIRGRVSGVTVQGTTVVTSGATLSTPSIPDPTLRTLGPVLPGEVLTFRANAAPGSTVDLLLGRFPTVVDLGGPEEDLLVIEMRRFSLGAVGAGGVIGFNFTVPAFLGDGFTFFAQAEVTLPGGEVRHTNSVPVVLR